MSSNLRSERFVDIINVCKSLILYNTVGVVVCRDELDGEYHVQPVQHVHRMGSVF